MFRRARAAMMAPGEPHQVRLQMFTLKTKVAAAVTCAAAGMLISWGADQVRAEQGAAPQDNRDEILATQLKDEKAARPRRAVRSTTSAAPPAIASAESARMSGPI